MSWRPLAGVRILELTTAWAGPYTGRMLGGLGADVIKIESPTQYDIWRGPTVPPPPGLGNYADNDPGDRPYNRTPMFSSANRNKRSLALDLATPRGKDIFFRLLKLSDAVVSNFSARVLPNLGLDYEALRAVKPDVILLAMPAYGVRGPYMNGAAYGHTIEAMAGLAARFGYEGDPPAFTRVTHGDPVAGVHGAVAAVAALLHRKRTGRGMFIDLSQQETMLAHGGEAVVRYSLDGRSLGREGAKAFSFAPQGFYPCRGEDEWIAVSAPSDEAWRALCDELGRREWIADARFVTAASRLANAAALDELIAAETASRDKRELAERLSPAGVTAAPVLTFEEMRTDPQLSARQALEAVGNADIGPRLYPRTPIVANGEPLFAARPTPVFGEHNRDVLEGLLGMSAEEVESLRLAGVTADEPANAFILEDGYYHRAKEALDQWQESQNTAPSDMSSTATS